MTDLEKLAMAYSAAWAEHDADAVIAHHADDTVFDIHGEMIPVAEGRDAVRELIAGLFALAPDLAFETKRVYFGHDHFTFEYVMTGTTGGATFACEGADIITVRDGQVVRKDTYLDTSTYERQISA